MQQQKYLSCIGTVAVTLCVEVLMIFSFSPAKAQSITFPPTEQRGAPSRTVGGGQRGGASCSVGNPPLTPLTPDNNVVTTVSANPTLFWYVPKTQAKLAELVIMDSNLHQVYQTTVEVKGVPGIIKVNIPTSVALKTGKKYVWKFSLICNPDRSLERFVAGWIERTELDMEAKTKLAKATKPLEKVEVYANAQVWQETLSILAQLHSERPHDPDVTGAWREFLTSVKLEEIATQPLVECCTVTP